MRSARERKYEGKTTEELLEENKDLTKTYKELLNTIRVMRKELEQYNEIKDKFEDQNRTFSVLYEKGIINEDGQLIEHIE